MMGTRWVIESRDKENQSTHLSLFHIINKTSIPIHEWIFIMHLEEDEVSPSYERDM